MTARGEGGKCRSNEPMGRTERRELGNKQKRKKERKDRASFHFEFVFYRVSFSSSLFKRGRRFTFRVPFSFPSTYIFFFSRSHGSKNFSNSHGFFGGGGEILQTLSLSFSLLLRPALTPLPQKRRIPFLLDRKQPPIGSESARVAKEEEEGKKEVSGASFSSSYFSPSLQPCMFYVLQ